MAQLTPTELAAHVKQRDAHHEAQRKRCTQPVSPANPIMPRDPGHRYSLRSGQGPKR